MQVLMAKRQKQTSLLSIWAKKARIEDDQDPAKECDNSLEEPETSSGSSSCESISQS